MEFNIGEIILEEELNIGDLSFDIATEKPNLENLEVYPSSEKQVFDHPNSYGYDVVTVQPLETEELNVIPSKEEQTFDGMYKKVNVVGEENLVPENIKKGVSIFNVEGTSKTASFEINNLGYMFYEGMRHEIMDDILSLCNNVTNVKYAFNANRNITELELDLYDRSNITEMTSMFYGANQMTKCICKLNTKNVTSMTSIFYGCSKLKEIDISSFDTSNVTNINGMFNGCSVITDIDLSNFNTSKLDNMGGLFNNCRILKNVNLKSFDTSNVTVMSNVFTNCASLINLDISNFDCGKVTIGGMFSNCPSLENLLFGINYGKAFTQKSSNYSSYTLNLGYSPNLTYNSLMDTINKLYDLNLSYNVVNGGTLYTQKFTIGNTNIAKLTAEEIAIATSKGWVVS